MPRTFTTPPSVRYCSTIATKDPMHRSAIVIVPAVMARSFKTSLCGLFNIKHGMGEGRSRYFQLAPSHCSKLNDCQWIRNSQRSWNPKCKWRRTREIPIHSHLPYKTFLTVVHIKWEICRSGGYAEANRSQLEDTPGQEEVALTRKFGDESYESYNPLNPGRFQTDSSSYTN